MKEIKNLGPRHLRRSVAKANMERQGVRKINRLFSGLRGPGWRKFAYVPSNEELAKALVQQQKDAKRRAKERAKRPKRLTLNAAGKVTP